MTSEQIQNTFLAGLNHLYNGRLKFAFDKIKILADELQWGELTDQCNELEQNYRFLLKYYVDGINDPERKIIYNKNVAKAFSLIHRLHEELMMRNSTDFEFGQKRIFQHKLHFSNYNDLLDSLNYYYTQTNLLSESVSTHEHEQKRLRTNFEKLLPDIFLIFWLTTSYQNSEKNLFEKILNSGYPGKAEKSLCVSALTLNLFRMFDEDKLRLLLDCCQHDDMQVRQRALTGLCFIINKYNLVLPYFPFIRNRLVLMTDDNILAENIKNIISLIIGTTDTDKITKKMREEILPEMMKISPMLKDKLESENQINTEDFDEENPAWQDILEQSGIADKMQELTELQLEGADVYMSTFSILKNFPFFNEIANWFMPFDPEMTAINDVFKESGKNILTSFIHNNTLCNSDKYSFCLSIMQMPVSQREMLTRSFKIEAEQLEEISKDETLLNPTVAARNIAKQYIQDLFRFFRLYSHHRDFNDIFDMSLSLHKSMLFELLSASDNQIRSEIAAFYFKKNHFREASDLLLQMTEQQEPDATVYQRLGFAYQNNSNINKALDAYLKADMIQPDDLWTLKKIAFCYKITEQYSKALETYKHVDFLKPKQMKIRMQIAHCYFMLQNYADALKIYFELDALVEDNEQIWRAISWTSFVSGQLQQAGYYMQKILETSPASTDFLNAGHIAFASKDRKKALQYYGGCLDLLQKNQEIFVDQFNSDKSFLQKYGIDESDLAYILDELFYQEEIN